MVARRPIEPEPPRARSKDPFEKMADRVNRHRFGSPVVDNQVELSAEIIVGIERWMAVEVRELEEGTDHDGAEGYGFDKFLAVLNRRCPGVLRAILDAGADIYV